VAYQLYSGNGTDDDGLVSGVVDNGGFFVIFVDCYSYSDGTER